MDRLFEVQESWAESNRFPDPAVVERNFSYQCPRYLDKWEYVGDEEEPVAEKDGLRCVPVGTIQFVQKWLEALGGADKAMTPLEIPYAMSTFLNRKYFRCKGTDLPKECLDGSKWFLKDASQLKKWSSLLYDDMDLSYYIEPDHVYTVSEKLEFASEWRVFVFNDEVVGCENYLGDILAFPDGAALSFMIQAYSKVPHPRAYTLDVGVIEKRFDSVTVPIEVHPFAACGLYGFNGLELADMYDAGWKWYLEEYVPDAGLENYPCGI